MYKPVDYRPQLDGVKPFSSLTRAPVVDIALKAKRSQSIFSLTAESSADVWHW
ncbi:MAG: hypothetical protein ACYTXT_44430 [Nostoc sp.]